jgi:uncharacterized membrane protein YgcG
VLAATEDLLTSLDPLPYGARMRRLAAWALAAADRAEVGADLRGGDDYERHLALIAALVARDTAGILAATRDPAPAVRGPALVAALRAGLLDTVVDLSAADRRRVFRTLRAYRLATTADALIAEVRPYWGDREAAAVLPACTAATVRRLLPDLEHAVNLGTLARLHPGPVLARAQERLAAAAPEHRDRLWHELAGALEACDPPGSGGVAGASGAAGSGGGAGSSSAAGSGGGAGSSGAAGSGESERSLDVGAFLDLAERYAAPDWLPRRGVLAAHDPARVARFLAEPSRAGALRRGMVPPALLRRLAVLPDDDLVPLAVALRDLPRQFAALLAVLPPGRRGVIYDRALAGTDTTELVPAGPVMEVLPAAVRLREATRVLGLARTREREDRVVTWSAYLAWPEASAVLDRALRSGKAEERQRAYGLLVDAARRSRDPLAVAEVVTRLGRLRNEQDPVRAAALTALGGVVRLLTPPAAAGLTRLTTDAVEARDASRATTAALASLAAGTLQHHVASPELCEWALLTIDLVGSASAVPLLRRFDQVLRRGQETLVFDRLEGWVSAAIERGRYGPLFGLTHALGERAWNRPGLQELLRKAIGPETSPWVGRDAVTHWLADPRHRDERVGEVLRIDPSAIAIPLVWDIVATSRTDLIDQVLRHRPRGRMIEAGQRWSPGPPRRAGRWLPRQQAAFVAAMEPLIGDRGEGVWPRARALRAVAGVAGPGRELVLRHVEDPEVVVAEAALAALVWTDRPDEALSVLLEFAGGDRARVALYAAGRAVVHAEPSRLPALLGGLLLAAQVKVTSRKEAARLLGRYGPPQVMTTLFEAYTHEGAHRDVRAAIVSAARQRLETEQSWAILETVAAGSREESRAVLAGGPWTIAGRYRTRYGALIVGLCRSADREVRREAFAALPAWAEWIEGVRELVAGRLADLHEQITSNDAAGLLPLLDGPSARAVLARLLELDAADGFPGRPGSDRPARRRVETLARAAANWSRNAPAVVSRTAVTDAAHWLAGRSGYLATAAELLAVLLPLDRLGELADLCAGRPVAAVRAADLLQSRTGQWWDTTDPAVIRDAVARLADRGDRAGGLFAVAMVGAGGVEWTEPWQRVLFALRGHPESEVSEAAYALRMTR